jgi:hypothetical protein
MDKILSARLDESAIEELDRMSRRLGLTKKRFLEEAIRLRAAQAAEETDVWSETSGAWRRRESTPTTIRRARRAFEDSAGRHRHSGRS